MPASVRPYMAVHAAADFEIDVAVVIVTWIVPDFLLNDEGLDGHVSEVRSHETSCGMTEGSTMGIYQKFVAMRFYFLMSWLKAKMPASLRPYTMTVHAAADFEIDVVVICDVDVVTGIVPDFLWNDGGLDGYVLEV